METEGDLRIDCTKVSIHTKGSWRAGAPVRRRR